MQSYCSHTGVKLMSHSVTICEGLFEARLKREVAITEQQYGFMLRTSSAEIGSEHLLLEVRPAMIYGLDIMALTKKKKSHGRMLRLLWE